MRIIELPQLGTIGPKAFIHVVFSSGSHEGRQALTAHHGAPRTPERRTRRTLTSIEETAYRNLLFTGNDYQDGLL